jgi:hypothetical protein
MTNPFLVQLAISIREKVLMNVAKWIVVGKRKKSLLKASLAKRFWPKIALAGIGKRITSMETIY